jgi:hypothetical protein
LGDNRGRIKPEAKALGMLLYGSGKVSYGMIARLFNVRVLNNRYIINNLIIK